MADINTLETWSGLDDALARNGQPPRAALWRGAAAAINHVIHRQPRVIFSQHIPYGTLAGTSQDPFLLYTYDQSWLGGRTLEFRCIMVALAPGTTAFGQIQNITPAGDAHSFS